jgi:hypothetical protein
MGGFLNATPAAAAGTGLCGMPERERAAGAGRPLLYFQLTSEQKGQWNPSRRERWNPLTRFAPPVSARFARLARFIQRPQTPHNPDQAGAGGASKAAALDCFLLAFAPLPPFPSPPATRPALNKRGPMAPLMGSAD